MPSGPKKRRAQKKKNEAAAARQNTENESTLTAISEESNPVIQTESTEGVTAVFDEPSIVFPKRTVLLESMLPSKVLEINRKDSEEGNKENAPLAEVFSDVQPLNVAEPSVKTGNAVISVKACGLDLVADECLDAEDSVFSNVRASEDRITFENKEGNAVNKNEDRVTHRNMVAVEDQETAAPHEVDDPERTEAVLVDEVIASKNQEGAVSEYVDDFEKFTMEAVVESQGTAAANEEGEMEVAVSEDVNEGEKITRKAVKLMEKLVAIPVATKPGVDIIDHTHAAVSTELVTPEVGQQLKEIKEMVEDVLKRLNAIDARLHRN